MKIIDSDNYAAAGIETLFFPGGEPHAKVPLYDEPLVFHAKLRTWNDVGIAACVISALQHQPVRSHIFIPYFPGARQDRTDGTAPYTVQMVHNLLRTDRPLTVFDPHSEATCHEGGIIDIMMPADIDLPIKDDVVGIIAPDAGAAHRAEQFKIAYYPDADLVTCTKTRDPQTGQLSNYKLPPLGRPGRYIVVDDICDGGGTFILLAKAFIASGAWRESQLELFVSHGIFSKGVDVLAPYYTCITTTDSWCRLQDTDNLRVIPLLPHYLRINKARGEFR